MEMARSLLSGLLVVVPLIACMAAGAGTGAEAVIIDGYDITASVSGTPLKGAYRDYFKTGVGLNGYNVQTDTVNSRAMTEIISTVSTASHIAIQ